MDIKYILRQRSTILFIIILIGIVLAYYSLFRMPSVEQSNSYLPSEINRNSRPLTMDDLSVNWKFRPVFLSPNDMNSIKISSSDIRIPRIIHQVWDTEMIPLRFEKWIRTWKIVNPDWEYWFWTLTDVRDLVEKYFKEHLILFDSYEGPIFRADVMRYFVLYKFGGVYMDLDMDAIKPLHNWTLHYDCILSEENYEHSFIVHENNDSNIVNGFIACRPNHPLMQLAIKSLPEAAHKNFGDYLHATGPLFFNEVYNKYKISTPLNDDVIIVPPIYFLPTFDDSESDTISGKCSPTRFRSLPEKSQVMCRRLLTTGFHNEPHDLAYTNHHWLHSYMFDKAWKKRDTVPIQDIVPSAILGSTRV